MAEIYHQLSGAVIGMHSGDDERFRATGALVSS